ncbi:MAG: tRNA pseudouridine(65) synthase TruC [Bacteroidales bacterium]|nr:tRNA pseudouridine(65) synthase TruC [Bacteroidales bacterium]
MELEIIYQDEQLIAINKPNGLLVHRSEIAGDVMEFAVQELRNQIGQHVFPAHRLDRKTSGVLLFSLNNETNKLMQRQFAENKVSKKYLAIVRGFTDDEGIIDYPLKKENGSFQEAITAYRTLKKGEIVIPDQRNPTSRYSLVEVTPETGRMHQIRRHFAHILHPIIGDRPHGCNKQNKIFKERFNMTTMMLHALEATFSHPHSKKEITITTRPPAEFLRMCQTLGLQF